ncbi:hypothetical protein [Ensifer canadensis]
MAINSDGCIEAYTTVDGASPDTFKVNAVLRCMGKDVEQGTATYVIRPDGFEHDFKTIDYNAELDDPDELDVVP